MAYRTGDGLNWHFDRSEFTTTCLLHALVAGGGFQYRSMYENERYRADFEAVCALCEERDAAVQTIKSVARGPWATTEPDRDTWYQPFEEPGDIE